MSVFLKMQVFCDGRIKGQGFEVQCVRSLFVHSSTKSNRASNTLIDANNEMTEMMKSKGWKLMDDESILCVSCVQAREENRGNGNEAEQEVRLEEG